MYLGTDPVELQEYIFILSYVTKQVYVNEYYNLKTIDQNQVIRRDIYDKNLFE
jgi:hypothetical protein